MVIPTLEEEPDLVLTQCNLGLLRGKITDAVTYLVQHHKMLGLIKQERKRNREKAAVDQ